MTYKDIINSIESFEYKKYKDISSNEKLIAYACKYLTNYNVPLYFNYIVVAAYKLFPDKFCLDDEFREYPSADRINRTILHMHTNKSGNNYLYGDAAKGFSLTDLGKLVGEQVEKEIVSGIHEETDLPTVDSYKKGYKQAYMNFVNSDLFNKYIETKTINLDLLWLHFKVIPFTRIKKIKDDLKNICIYAKENGHVDCIDCIKAIEKEI